MSDFWIDVICWIGSILITARLLYWFCFQLPDKADDVISGIIKSQSDAEDKKHYKRKGNISIGTLDDSIEFEVWQDDRYPHNAKYKEVE